MKTIKKFCEKKACQLIGTIETIARFFLILMMGIMVLVSFAQVVSRYVFNDPFTWSEELGRYLFIWVVYLGAFLALKHQEHLSLDILSQRLPLKHKRLLVRVNEGILLIFLIIVLIYTPDILTLTFQQTSAVLSIPLGIIYAAFPTSAVFMSLEIVCGWLVPDRSLHQVNPRN
jgi:TRAP-type transport system small permease protein